MRSSSKSTSRLILLGAAATAAALSAGGIGAIPCAMFDSTGGLYFFGVYDKDYSAGSDPNAWASPSLTLLPSAGRPPFNGANTQCFLTQFYNAMYVLNGDASNPSDVHIYDFAGSKWSTQKIASSGSAPNPSTLVATIDHDTNVFYAYDAGLLYFLSFDGITTSSVATSPSWTLAQSFAPSSDTTYKAVIGAAHNHIHFLNVPGSQPASAYIYVVHYAWWQPAPQSYPSTPSFPVAHGQTASLYRSPADVQPASFAFVPDDGSGTFIVNTNDNATTVMAPPPGFAAAASYAASSTGYLAMLAQTGAAAVVAVDGVTTGASAGNKWTAINSDALKALAGSAPAGFSSVTSNPTATTTGAGAASTGGSTGGASLPSATVSKSTATGTTSSKSGSPASVSASFALLASALAGSAALGVLALF